MSSKPVHLTGEIQGKILAPGCSDDHFPPFETLPCPEPVSQSGNPVQHEMAEVRSFVNEQLDKAITSAVAKSKSAQREEDERIAAIVRELGKNGQYVLNERPEGMSFEDYKIVRARLKKFKQHYIHGGTPVHKSIETEVRPGKSGRRQIFQKGKGVTYRKPFEVPEDIEKAISAPQPDPLTQQLSK